MRCDHAHDDAAFLLGSLGAADRVEYERHLRECEDCAARVRDLAGLPGLLGRVPPELLEPSWDDADPPDTLLPALEAEVRRTRRRTVRTVAVAVAAAVVAIAGAAGVLVLTLAGDDRAPTAAPTAPAQQMEPVGASAVTGWVSLTAVPWGTRIDLTCTYESTGGIGGRYDDRDSGATSYAMVVHTTDGKTQSAGTWRAEDGQETHVSLATDAAPGDIASVEVTTADGDSVLRLRSPAQ